MSTCSICLKDFEVGVEQETRGHKSCVNEENSARVEELEVENANLQEELQQEESEISDLQDKLRELRK